MGSLRAKINVTQTQMQLADLERQALIDVEEAVQEYEVTRRRSTSCVTKSTPEPSKCVTKSQRLYKCGSEERSRLPRRSARVQSDRQAVPRHSGSAPAQHAVAEHGRRPADHALSRSSWKSHGPAEPATSGRRRWDVESLVTCGHFSKKSSAASLLSAITDVMAGNSIAAADLRSQAAALVGARQSVPPSRLRSRRIKALCSIPPIRTNPINNMALAPTGTLSKRQQRRERFVARYVGTLHGRCRTDERRTDSDLHRRGRFRQYDVALGYPIAAGDSQGHRAFQSAASARSSTVTSTAIRPRARRGCATIIPIHQPSLGYRRSLPTVSLDANLSSGTYDEGYAVGTMSIHYLPSDKHTPGVLSQGKAIVTIHAQIYTANVGFILRNANIDP